VGEISIVNGGSGYQPSDEISVIITDGEADADYPSFYGIVATVDGNGSITEVALGSSGAYFKSTGEVESVTITEAGRYYTSSGEPVSAFIFEDSKGLYYGEDPDEPPHVADVKVTITQRTYYAYVGSGATVDAVVDDDPASPSFGQITSLERTDPGEGYLSAGWFVQDCPRLQDYNGNSYLINRVSPCVYRTCHGFGEITLRYNGPSEPPSISIRQAEQGLSQALGLNCVLTLIVPEQEPPFLCEPVSFVGTDLFGGTATVAEVDEDDPPLPTCADLQEASSITYEITAEDWEYENEQTREYFIVGDPDNVVFTCVERERVSFAGSAYAGTFELTFDEVAFGSRIFRYAYPAGANFCDISPELVLAVRAFPPLSPPFELAFFGLGGKSSYTEGERDVAPSCTIARDPAFGQPLDFCDYEQTGVVGGSHGPIFPWCGCDIGALDGFDVRNMRLTRSKSSDENSDNIAEKLGLGNVNVSSRIVSETITETGSPIIGVRFVGISND
jgi:hypothetical protein